MRRRSNLWLTASIALGLLDFSIRAAYCAPAAEPTLVWPLERSAYFSGESAPLAFHGLAAGAPAKLEALREGDNQASLLYAGPAVPVMIDVGRLMPGSYSLQLNGAVQKQTLRVVSTLRHSAGSLQDEVVPSDPSLPPNLSPEQRTTAESAHWNQVATTLHDSGLTACISLGSSDMGEAKYLDVLARSGTLLLVNPDTRPTSFFPLNGDPLEIDGMSQRVILTGEANGRYPNFGGFLFGWDVTGYSLGNRKGLMTYWGWGDKTQALRNYLQREDDYTRHEFTSLTGLAPVSESEYIAYLLAIDRPEFAPAIDLPNKIWIEEIARHTKPLSAAERAAFESRLDAWSTFLMSRYREHYAMLARRLRDVDPSLRNSASIQVDHQAVRNGQYFPWAYEPLDFHYQTTWNDQVGGPDYAFQWLFTAGLLDMQRQGKPTWLSNSLAAAHDRAKYPGKFPRVAAHGLAWGVSGIGFALEGFSNILAGMNPDTNWEKIHGKSAEADLLAGREFLDRFSSLAVAGQGNHGVGIVFSRGQFERQHLVEGFGSAHYKAFVTLTRLGYSPRFVTEEDLVAGRLGNIAALVVFDQTFPLASVSGQRSPIEALDEFTAHGGRILVDANTTLPLPHAEKLPLAIPFSQPGKPHNWMVPNMIAGEDDTVLEARWHAQLAPVLSAALGDTGRGLLRVQGGPSTEVSLVEIAAGADAHYVVAINDSHVASQADWHQVREQIVPSQARAPANPPLTLYDCTDEKRLGPVAEFTCDLSATTARVYALLARSVESIELSARQKLVAGEEQLLAVRFLDGRGEMLRGVVPFELTLQTPQHQPFHRLYRSTDREGTFAIRVPVAANAPAGEWAAEIRSQLDGRTAMLPFTVASRKNAPTNQTANAAVNSAANSASPTAPLAAAIEERLIVRNRPEIERAFAKGSKLLLPIFPSPQADQIRHVADQLKAALAERGVELEVRPVTELANYVLSYDPTAEQIRENARVDSGQAIGRIYRDTVNSNDWFSALSGYRCGASLVVLDLIGQGNSTASGTIPANTAGPASPGARPLAAALENCGALWPRVSADFPGPGRAVLQAVPWAFAPGKSTIAVQATDAEGLSAVVKSLAKLPPDRFSPAIQAVRQRLWQEFHVGGAPEQPRDHLAELTRVGLRSGFAPQPFAIHFGDERPPRDAPAPQPAIATPSIPLPAKVLPKQYTIYYRDVQGKFIETATVDFLVPDLRFSQAIGLQIDNPKSGPVKIVATGQFRYSDRSPRRQAQWEDILTLHDSLVPRIRQPMQIQIYSGDDQLGQLTPSATAERDVPLQEAFPSASLKPKTSHEEVVTQLTGTIDLPAGQQKLFFVPRHIVDGSLEYLTLGDFAQGLKK